MTLLDKKIKLCEDFLKAYANYDRIHPFDFREEGNMPVIIYRLKLALILQFLESVGIKKEIGYLDEFEFADEEGLDMDFYYPDEKNFETWMKDCSPYLHIVDMSDTRYVLSDLIYGNESSDDDTEEESSDVPELTDAVECDLAGFPLKEKTAKEIANYINDWFRYQEYDLFHYAQWDELSPLYFKRCKERVMVDGKEVVKTVYKNEDTLLIDRLYQDSLPVSSQMNLYDVYYEEEPFKLLMFTFGADDSGYEPFNATQTNFVYAIQMALLHLYIFRLDKTLHFLPKEYKGGERKILPRVKLN